MGDPQKMNGCLENLTAIFVLQGSLLNIIISGVLHGGVLYVQEGQDLPVRIHKHSINVVTMVT